MPSTSGSIPPAPDAAIQTAAPPSPQRSIPTDLTDRLREMVALLETPIDQLVQGEDHLLAMPDSTAEHLPADLREVLYGAVDLHLYRAEVIAAPA